MTTDALNNTLRALSNALRIPVLVLLIFILALTVVMLGSLIAEIFTERRRLKASMPALVGALGAGTAPLDETVKSSGLLNRQKKALLELISRRELPEEMRVSLARRLIFEEESRYERLAKITDVIARVGPMLGLLGTLIPLGPGLIALGQGDTFTLSASLLTAFDTTIAGLAASAVAFIISIIRKRWYENYMSALETAMECVLEGIKNGQA